MVDDRLQQLIPTYRRDSEDINGAMRISYIETIVMEQMSGGRFQIAARTNGGDAAYVTRVQPTLQQGQQMLETMRRFLGGQIADVEVPTAPMLTAQPRTLDVPERSNDGFMQDL